MIAYNIVYLNDIINYHNIIDLKPLNVYKKDDILTSLNVKRFNTPKQRNQELTKELNKLFKNISKNTIHLTDNILVIKQQYKIKKWTIPNKLYLI